MKRLERCFFKGFFVVVPTILIALILIYLIDFFPQFGITLVFVIVILLLSYLVGWYLTTPGDDDNEA